MLKFMVALAFIVMVSVRFCKIRPIGFAKTTVFSKLFLAKVYGQYVQALLVSLLITFFLMSTVYTDSTDYQAITQARFYSLFLLIEVVAWVVAAQMMRYEYRKRLSESYPHWFFWSVSALVDILFLVLNFSIYVSTWHNDME